jgi:Cdc6-like AAA superfamily ATPase
VSPSPDRALADAVRDFVDELSPVVAEIASDLDGVDADELRHDVVLEAYNLSLAFIDCDDRQSDDELLGLIIAFGPRLESQLDHATPELIREAGLVTGTKRWLGSTTVLFDILRAADERSGTQHARRYYDLALQIAYTVASLDERPSEAELRAIDGYRGLLLHALDGIRVRPPARLGHAEDAPTSTPATATAAVGATPPVPTEAEAPLEPPRPLDELLAELDELVGLAAVKAEVKLVTDLISVQNLRRDRKLKVVDTSRHLVFTGNPGTGKTTVARLVAQIFRTLGVVTKGQLVETDRSQLVVGYIGQTATRVREVFDRADGGVLLIDEAYALARGGERDFGIEAIDTIVKLVEDRRDSVVVIAAGYPDEMRDFIEANPGLRSRFPRTIAFPDYTNDELLAIFSSQAEGTGYECPSETLTRVRAWFEAQPRVKGFGNGRLARNLFEEAVGRQASRIVAAGSPSNEQLATLAPEDIPEPVPVAPEVPA